MRGVYCVFAEVFVDIKIICMIGVYYDTVIASELEFSYSIPIESVMRVIFSPEVRKSIFLETER
jgi:hypothetical protein